MDDKAMYEVRCPYCRHTMMVVNLRRGVMLTCHKCEQVFSVQAKHVICQLVPGARKDSGLESEFTGEAGNGASTSRCDLPGVNPGARAEGEPKKNKASRAGGRGGEGQELLGWESDRAVMGEDELRGIGVVSRNYMMEGRGKARGGGRGYGRQLALRAVRKRQQKALAWLIAGVAAMSVLAAVSYYYGPKIGLTITSNYKPLHPGQQAGVLADEQQQKKEAGQKSQVEENGSASEAPEGEQSIRFFVKNFDLRDLNLKDLNLTDEMLPRVESQSLEPGEWKLVEEQYLAPVRMGPVSLVNEQLSELESRDGRLIYSAQVVSVAGGVIPLARLELALVGFDQRVIGRLEVSAAMLENNRPEEVRVVIPADLSQRMMRIAWSVREAKEFPREFILREVLIEPRKEGKSAEVRVIVFNPTDRVYEGVRFLVRALDGQGKVCARWRMDWSEPINAGEVVGFLARTPLEQSWDVQHWDAVGVGQVNDSAGGTGQGQGLLGKTVITGDK